MWREEAEPRRPSEPIERARLQTSATTAYVRTVRNKKRQ